MDYQGNAKKDKAEPKPEKKIERIVSGEVLVQKKSIGKKFKDVFVEADFRSVMHYVVADVLLPSIRNLIVDASTKGIERMMYGESAIRRRNIGGLGSRITYNNPINRGYASSSPLRNAPPVAIGPRSRSAREDFILSTREEADAVLEQMIDIIDVYDVVSLGDLYQMIGYPTSHTDEKWGWTNLANAQVRQVREGYLIDFPPAEALG